MAVNEVQIGSFLVQESETEGKVWLFRDDGEGGEFDEEALAELLGKFYEEHF